MVMMTRRYDEEMKEKKIVVFNLNSISNMYDVCEVKGGGGEEQGEHVMYQGLSCLQEYQ